MKTHIILLGPPGAGKGTQGQMLGKMLKVPFISSGDALREELSSNTEVGSKFKKYINAGLLVPDGVVEEFIEKLLNKYNLEKGFIFDGFPRTVHQADFVMRYLKSKGILLDTAIYLFVSDEEAVKRISGRRICPKCGAVYNIYFNPPQDDMKCDKCGTKLIQRDDDKEKVVKNRFKVYENETDPLISFFEENGLLQKIDAVGSVEGIQNKIQEALND